MHVIKQFQKHLCNFIGCIFNFLHCAFSNVSSNGLPERMQSHIGCICLTFPHCVFSYVSSNGVHKRMHNHTGCICWTFLHCVFSNVSSNCLPERMQSHIGCICLTFLHCAFSNVSLKHLGQSMPRLCSAVHFQMCSQIVCPRRCIVTLVAFV